MKKSRILFLLCLGLASMVVAGAINIALPSLSSAQQDGEVKEFGCRYVSSSGQFNICERINQPKQCL